jgi:protein-L-isoaspartate(D-aspartate) O-methyltransferase
VTRRDYAAKRARPRVNTFVSCQERAGGFDAAMTDDMAAARHAYAEELRFAARIRSPALVAAFASVPRERFLGPGPWRVKSPMDLSEYWTTDTADPRAIYHDVLVALDEARGINNGEPRLWAYLLDRLHLAPGERVLHLACGTGYYTAIMAELVGPAGKITAIEVDAMLAERARVALARWPQVAVSQADASDGGFDPVDIVVASAGATHPLPAWIDAVKPGGRLLVPLTTRDSWGGMLLVSREGTESYAARFLTPAGFIPCVGARNPSIGLKLASAFARDRGRSVKSLRRDEHAESETCWLHGGGWCLSKLAALSL